MTEQAGEMRSPRDASDEDRERTSSVARSGGMGSEAHDMSNEDVRRRAHEIYLSRGGADGDPVADWLEAEQEIRGRSAASRTPDDMNGRETGT